MTNSDTRVGKLCLAIQTNTDGRPCAWGIAPTEKQAVEIADAQWCKHGEVTGVDSDGNDIRTGYCYPGEERGPISVSWVDGVTEVDGQLVNTDGKPLATQRQERIRRGVNRFVNRTLGSTPTDRGMTARELMQAQGFEPDIACEACDGTGTNNDAEEVYAGNCLECGGNGYKLAVKRHYKYAAPTYSRDRKGGGK